MNRELAKRNTRNAQLVGGAMLVAAAGLFFIPADMWAAAAGTPARTRPEREEKSGSRFASGPDAVSLALALEAVSPDMPDEQPPAPPPPPPEPEVAAAPPPTPVQTWRYIGGIFGGALKKAIVVIDENQRFVSPGDTVNGAKVVEVVPEYVAVDENGVRRYIPIAQRLARTAVPLNIPVAAAPMPTAIGSATADQLMNLESLRQKDRAAYLAEKRRLATQLQAGSNIPFTSTMKKEGAEDSEESVMKLIKQKAAAAGRNLSEDEQNTIRKEMGLKPLNPGEPDEKKEEEGGG